MSVKAQKEKEILFPIQKNQEFMKGCRQSGIRNFSNDRAANLMRKAG
jgi:predicted peroxiredoxin